MKTYFETVSLDIFTIEIRSDEAINLNPGEREKLNKLLKTYASVFAEKGPLAKFASHHINIGNNMPIVTTPYRLSPIKRNILKEELNKMIADEIIEESETPYAAPVALIAKKDGGTRVCIDYRKLNSITTPDRYPLPRIDDLLHDAKSSAFMSTMDLRSGYWQIEVAKNDREKTAFITPFGMYQFNRMPFGLRNAPATFQRLMDHLKNQIPDIPLLIYLDDLILLSASFNEHLIHLEKVFQQLKKFQLRAHREKCKFGCPEIKYLGHIISRHGICHLPFTQVKLKLFFQFHHRKILKTYYPSCKHAHGTVVLFQASLLLFNQCQN